MSKPVLMISIVAVAMMLSAGGALTKPLQSPGSIRTLPGEQGTITTPSAGSSHLSGHARAYRMCFWKAKHPSPGMPSNGYCIAPAGGDPGSPCNCRTQYGVFDGEVG